MKKHFSILILLIFFIFFLSHYVSAEDDSTTIDSSTSYIIELGDGQGAILVFGDNNTIYLPDTTEPTIIPNEITITDDRVNLVLTDTDLIVDGVRTRYDKMVFVFTGKEWDLVWFTQ